MKAHGDWVEIRARRTLRNPSVIFGSVVSGRVKLVKPDPAIYREMHARIEPHLPGIAPHELVFIDDNAKNAAAATALGWHGIHHTSAAATEARLRDLGALA
nr:HAD-IA family hydrolase [Ralstonia pickettii]